MDELVKVVQDAQRIDQTQSRGGWESVAGWSRVSGNGRLIGFPESRLQGVHSPSDLDEALKRMVGLQAVEVGQLAPGNDPAVLLVAPHQAPQRRGGSDKKTEPVTGAMAVAASRLSGAVSLVSTRELEEAAWWHRRDVIARRTQWHNRSGKIVFDLHGMQDGYHVDVCIGSGPHGRERHPWLVELAVDEFERAGLHVAVDQPFSGTADHALTSMVQYLGGRGLQLEWSWSLREAVAEGDLLPVESLARLVRRMH